MNNVETADKEFDHLFPAFRTKLEAVLAEVAAHTGEPWTITEGFRSQARQDWLYAQGRTRPGPIVTWVRHAYRHGIGLAADCIPVKTGYQAPLHWWQLLLHVGIEHGLANPAFHLGDHGHLQLDADVAEATAWVARGFK